MTILPCLAGHDVLFVDAGSVFEILELLGYNWVRMFAECPKFGLDSFNIAFANLTFDRISCDLWMLDQKIKYLIPRSPNGRLVAVFFRHVSLGNFDPAREGRTGIRKT